MSSYGVYGGVGIVNTALLMSVNQSTAKATPVLVDEVDKLISPFAFINSVPDSVTFSPYMDASFVPPHAPVTVHPVVNMLTSLGADSATIIDGHVMLDGISLTDIGTITLITLSAVSLFIKAYMDVMHHIEEAKINRIVMNRYEARRRKENDRGSQVE